MAPAHLSPHIHLARVGNDLVLLDVRADSYLCIPDGVAVLRPTDDRASVRPPDDDFLADLQAAKIVDEGVTPRTRPPRLPKSDFGPYVPQTLRVREAFRLGASLWDLFWRYRGQPIGAIIAFAAAAPGAGRPVSPEMLRLAQLFHRVAAWLPIPRKCLVRSFVLLRFLQRSGLNAQWVFGVRTWPFAAHCWLQADDVVLDDVPERLAAYEPIYVVG